MWQMLFAGALFVGAHLGVSSTPLRAKLVGAVGERGYLGIYSLLALATIGYLIWIYGDSSGGYRNLVESVGTPDFFELGNFHIHLLLIPGESRP